MARHERNMEFAFLDAWMEELQEATKRRLEASNPNIKMNRLYDLSRVTAERDNTHTWIFIGLKWRFVVRESDGLIFDAEGGTIRTKHCYGPVGQWEAWDWQSYYPVRRESFWDSLMRMMEEKHAKQHTDRQGAEEGNGEESGKDPGGTRTDPRRAGRKAGRDSANDQSLGKKRAAGKRAGGSRGGRTGARARK